MPSKSVYSVGERLECWAYGNPAPKYEWMEIGTDKTISGSVLTIDDSLRSEKNHSFRCTAYNTVTNFRREIYKTILFTVEGTGKCKQSLIETLMCIDYCLIIQFNNTMCRGINCLSEIRLAVA